MLTCGMAISRDLLATAKRPLADRIMDFLNDRADQAFTLFEIYGGVEGYEATVVALTFAVMSPTQRAQALVAYREALDGLTQNGRVEKAEVRGLEHYAVAR